MSFSLLGQVFGISGKKIFRWYHDVLSGYCEEGVQKTLHEYDTKDPTLHDPRTKEVQTVFVPIVAPEHMGEDMCIDDKHIGGEGYTILSNKKTGKIAALIMSTKAGIVGEVLQQFPMEVRLRVKTLSKDLAESYDWVARTMFLNATRIADKFHVLKLGFEAVQAVRIRYRQEVLTEEKKKKTAQKVKDALLSSGESLKELLARSRYLLFQYSSTWSTVQRERATLLFQRFPDLNIAYSLLCSFRLVYTIPIGKRVYAKTKLSQWYTKVEKNAAHIPEMLAFLKMVRAHEDTILNYFDAGHTNAFAESLNNRIQTIFRTNYGIRERDFFHFRLKKLFASENTSTAF